MGSKELNFDNLERYSFDINKQQRKGYRLDVYLARRFQAYSRSDLQKVIQKGLVKVNQEQKKKSYQLCLGDTIDVELPQYKKYRPQPEDIPLDVLYEDDELLVVNKPPMMVTHPGGGHWSGTLVNAILGYCEEELPGQASKENGEEEDSNQDQRYRPGIVHRLDKETSGVIIAVKTGHARSHLGRQFENREVDKEYFALVRGTPRFDQDRIDLPLGPHPGDNIKRAVREDGKRAVTIYNVIESFGDFSALQVKIETGRTHQIRVHLAHIGYPVLADTYYGPKDVVFPWELQGKKRPSDLEHPEAVLHRQALHARRIAFAHPSKDERIEVKAPLPDDLQTALTMLHRHN